MSGEELEVLIMKAKKWDDLNKEISAFYSEDSDGDLFDIGEITAIAFGYL